MSIINKSTITNVQYTVIGKTKNIDSNNPNKIMGWVYPLVRITYIYFAQFFKSHFEVIRILKKKGYKVTKEGFLNKQNYQYYPIFCILSYPHLRLIFMVSTKIK